MNTVQIFAQNIKLPAQPNPPKLVVDFANILSPSEMLSLETKLNTFNDSTSNQISIVTIPSLDGNEIAQYANELYRKWGIGTKKNNNGVLVLVAVNDHKMRIEAGYGLEGALPDLLCAEIIRNDMAPNFKRGDYYTGLDQATSDILSATKGEYQADPQNNNTSSGGIPFPLILLGIFIILFILTRINSKNNKYYMSRNGSAGWDNNSTSTGFLLGNLLSNLGGGGGSDDWGGGGGGFGGFGGGSSGGGGASGSW